MLPYKYLFGTVFLGLFFLVPFALRFQSHSLEPYPSVLFPSGAVWVEFENDEYTFQFRKLFGKDAQTQRYRELNAGQFMDPIPKHYFGYVLNNQFGLDPDLPKTDHYRWAENKVTFPFKRVTELERQKARAWVKGKLIDQGFLPDQIKVTYVEGTVRRQESELKSVEIIDEELFEFN